jgi:serine/threonine protein kinase/formylglycine-generating enzyme required for sulfatase activity
MVNHALLHPTEQTLSDFGLGKLDDGQAEIINNHLNECSECQRLVAEMSSDSFLGRLRGAEGQSSRTNTGIQAPIMSKEPGDKIKAGTLPPDLADHPDYQVVRELGRGGMGVVYLAHNRLMGRDEVLKVVSKHLIERKGVLERFSREIRSAARLMHPNIVHAYSAFRCGESVVFAMEYVDGLDLAKLVKTKGPMSVPHACYFVHQAALGLQHAHEQGMVHRDIKPGNLMLTRKGDKSVVKVLDFGLAKATRESPTDGALTHEGQMLGTPDFIAPEQIRDAQSAGIQADIYSLGCTLYYLLTGTPPFQGPSLYDLLQAHFSMDAQPLNLIRPEVPAELAALVAKMMAKDLGRRFQTPAEVAEALKPFFKKAGAISRPEVSMLGQPGARPEKVQAVSAVTEPAKKADSPSFSSGTQLPTLGEFNEPERSGDVPPAVPALGSGSRPPWKSLPLVAAAGALGLVMLGVIIIIITRNGHVTIDTEKGNTTITIEKTAVGSGGLSASAGEPGDSRVGKAPVPPATPPSGTEPVTAASGSGSAPSAAAGSSAGEPAATPTGDRRADTAADPLPSGVKPAPLITNSIDMKLALIPAGEFMMGSPDNDKDAGIEEKPQHRVRISKSFYLGVYEVTQAQDKSVMGNNPRNVPPNGDGKDKVAGQSTDQYPVTGVSWFDAVIFCNKLSAKEGRRPFYEIDDKYVRVPDWNGPGYRLPTEAEWEYACRANESTPTRYSFGDDAAQLDDYGWFQVNSSRIHPVGKKKPNGFGLHDMHGNVSEWCWDWYDEGYYKQSREDDPTGPAFRVGLERVLRGGSSSFGPGWVRSAFRERSGPTDTYDNGVHRVNYNLGFRVARDKITARLEPPVVERAGKAKAPANVSTAPPDSPEGRLNARGLTRSGAYFVLASEAEILEKFEKVRPLIASMAQPFNMFAQALNNEMRLAGAEEIYNELRAWVDAANAVLAKMPNGTRTNSEEKLEYQNAKAALDVLTQDRDRSAGVVEAMRAQQVPAERKAELVKDFNSKWSDFLKAADELTPLIDKTLGEYRKLQGDASVKDALAAFSRSAKAAAILGPSKNLQNAHNAIRDAKRAYAPETAAPKKKARSTNAPPKAAPKKKAQAAKR